MNNVVKSFINNSIDLIETQDWDTLFNEWVGHAQGSFIGTDTKLMEELFSILETIYPDIYI